MFIHIPATPPSHPLVQIPPLVTGENFENLAPQINFPSLEDCSFFVIFILYTIYIILYIYIV